MKVFDPRPALDRVAGAAVSRTIVAHHRRRLRRTGWLDALEAEGFDWRRAGAPRRAGCRLEVLIDGATALPRIAAELARAESHVHLAGWFFTPELDLTRSRPPVVLRNLLAELSTRVDVRVLAWAGSPLPLFRPSRGDVRTMRARLCDGTNICCALDAHERPMHCHHEKMIVVDDRVAFVGGIDLTTESGDRFDTSAHPARAAAGWHDVSTVIHGPAVIDVAEHFRTRWHAVTGTRLPPAGTPEAIGGGVELDFVRTVPERIYRALPAGDFTILGSYLGALRSARELIYLENQFLWSPEIVEVIAAKLRSPPTDEFRVLALLPARPNNGADDTRGALAELIEADAGRHRFLACTLYARHHGLADPVYVHAKVAVVDDRWLTVGSANLNDHSLFNDTELNVVTRNGELARRTRLRLWAEHLEAAVEDVSGPAAEIFDTRWQPTAREQLDRRGRGEPLTHRVVALPNLSRRSDRLLGPLQGLLVDG